MLPEVSFIVPIYKVEKYLNQCVESILGQSNKNFELILVDDGSPDGCPAICDQYAAKSDKIKVLHQANAGVSVARNAGIATARGEWIVFVDADDWVSVDLVQEITAHAQSDLDIVLFSYAEIYGDTVKSHVGKGNPQKLNASSMRDAMHAVLNRYHKGSIDYRTVHLTGSCGKAYRRSVILQHNLSFPQGILSGEDSFFNFCFLEHVHTGIMVQFCAYYYRKNSASVTQRYNPVLRANYEHVVALYQQQMQVNRNFDEFQGDWMLFLASCGLFIALRDTCHPQNPHPYAQRKAAFLSLCTDSVFSRGLYTAKLHQFSAAKALVCYCMRYKQFALLCFFMKMVNGQF